MAEITTTQSFSDGDTVTATKLNNIQANASVQPDAITNRTAETSIDQVNDLLLIYDASATALKKVSASDLIKAGTASNFPITGNATIGGTLGVTGTSALTGNTTIGGTLGVTGTSTLTGNTAVGGTLAVTGAITATSTINGTTIPTTKTLVTTVDTQTLTNKTLTTPVISSISNTGTLTLPTATDTLVGRATTDTLTNKTLTTPIISSITNTGTLTLPTATDTLVGRTTTDTLTNKTLTSPTINTSAVSGGTINNATIGATTPSTGSFTSLSATSLSVTNTITGSVSGNAGTATDGVVTTGTYANPAWITSLAKSKVGLTNVPDGNWADASNLSSGTMNLARLGTLATGQVLAGNAGTATATTLSGDATIGATGTITLANSGATSGTYGSSSLIPTIAIDAKGRITSASNTSFSTTPADGTITAPKLSGAQTGSAPIFGVRAWVLYDQTVPSVTSSANVSSVTDTSLGVFTVNFSTAMPSANYTISGSGQRNVSSGLNVLIVGPNLFTARSTTSARCMTDNTANTKEDSTSASVVFMV